MGRNLYRSLQLDPTNKVLLWGIVRGMAVNQDRSEDVGKGIHVDPVEIVNAIEDARISGGPKVGYVGFGEEVGNIRSGINDWSADDTDGIWYICAADFALEERRVHLASIESRAGLRIDCTDPVLRGSQEDELSGACKGSVHQGLRIELLPPDQWSAHIPEHMCIYPPEHPQLTDHSGPCPPHQTLDAARPSVGEGSLTCSKLL